MQDKDLLPFLKAWYYWATHNAPEHRTLLWWRRPVFRRNVGLCNQAQGFLKNKAAKKALETLFDKDGLDCSYPFGGSDFYDQEGDLSIMHLNHLRLEWVKRTIERLSAACANCGGQGVDTSTSGIKSSVCPICDGTGRIN